MTKALFLFSDGEYISFTVCGHASDISYEGRDTVCAAISSAVYLTANNITDIIGDNAEIKMRDGYFSLFLKDGYGKSSSGLIKGLLLHLNALSKQYPENIKVKVINTSLSEVQR